MKCKRVYLQPMKMVYNAILDMMELQKGEELINDFSFGKLHFTITMYGFTWELRFTVFDLDFNRCCVNLEIEEFENDEEQGYLRTMIHHEYVLLDSMILFGTPSKVTYKEEGSI